MLRIRHLYNRKPRAFFICINCFAILTLFSFIFKNHTYANVSLINVATQPPKIYKTEYTVLLNKLGLADDVYKSFDIIDDYMTTNTYKAFESPNLMPKRKVNYDRKKVVATKFGDQKYIQLLNTVEQISTDKNLYFLLKYYLWCLVNNINYPIVPININEWQRTEFEKPNLFSLNKLNKCECDSIPDLNTLDYREKKESIHCKKKQSQKFMQESCGFNPDLAMFLFKEDLNLDFLTVRLKVVNQPVTESLAFFLKEIDHFNHVNSKKINNIYYPINEIIDEIRAYNSFNSPYPSLSSIKLEYTTTGQLLEKDFAWSLEDKVEDFKNLPKGKSRSEFDTIRQSRRSFMAQKYHSIKINLKNLVTKKYFYEVAIKSKIENVWRSGTHYDWRFFKGLKPLSDRNEILNDLFDVWTTFTKKDEIKSWLSHGNLLSWAWSGGQFLWDKDLDIQLPISHFAFMAENYNNTVFMYMNFKNELKMYYLDINPCYSSNYHGPEGKNTIDGRFIDVESGLYIDLTAISYKQIELETAPTDKNAINGLNKLKWSKNLIQKMKQRGIAKSDIVSGTKTTLLGDKNYHFYQSIDTLLPLRKVKYGHLESETYVPYDITGIIKDEYPNGLVKSEYDDYNFDLDYHGWVKKCESKSDKSDHRNCEGLSDEQFDFTKKGWLKHYNRELKFCSHKVVSNSAYCQWFIKLNEEVEEQQEGILKIFGTAHKYLSGKSESNLIEENLKVFNDKVNPVLYDKSKLIELGYPVV